jgi:hypothetical protein
MTYTNFIRVCQPSLSHRFIPLAQFLQSFVSTQNKMTICLLIFMEYPISIYPSNLTYGISSLLLNVDPLYFLYYEQSVYMRHFHIKQCLLTIFNHDCLFNYPVQHLAN